jgi:hypothetical protein
MLLKTDLSAGRTQLYDMSRRPDCTTRPSKHPGHTLDNVHFNKAAAFDGTAVAQCEVHSWHNTSHFSLT